MSNELKILLEGPKEKILNFVRASFDQDELEIEVVEDVINFSLWEIFDKEFILESVTELYSPEELFSKEEILGAARLVATSEELFKCAKDVMKWELVEPAKENVK